LDRNFWKDTREIQENVIPKEKKVTREQKGNEFLTAHLLSTTGKKSGEQEGNCCSIKTPKEDKKVTLKK